MEIVGDDVEAPYPHFDIPLLWQFIVTSLSHFATTYDIKAITVTTHGASVALLDHSGELATPVLDYEHNGPDVCKTAYQKIRPPFSQTGSPLLAGGLNIGAQLHWLFEQQPDLKDTISTVLMYPQYWTYRLTGELANEPTSLGCHTDLWNPTDACYSDLTQTLQIIDKMAEVKLPTEVLGPILPAIAHSTGLVENTPVYCGIHDSNASLYTHLTKLDSPFSVVLTGTWVVSMAVGTYINNHNAITLNETRDTLLNVNVLGNPTPSSRFMGGREYDYLVKTYKASETKDISQHVIKHAALILPAVEPSSGPFQNTSYQWSVDPWQLSPEQRYNAISFYLALMTNTCLDLCFAKGPIIIEGPFKDNHLFCAMLNVSSGRSVLCNDGSATGTSVGAAMLASAETATGDHNYRSLVEETNLDALNNYSTQWKAVVASHVA